MNPPADDLHPGSGLRAAQPPSSTTQGAAAGAIAGAAGATAGAGRWPPVPGLAFATWKEALRHIEKKMARAYPQSANQAALWFGPMPLVESRSQGNEIVLRFTCSSARRKEAVLALRAILEDMLTREVFANRQRVRLELIDDFAPAMPASNQSSSAVPSLEVRQHGMKEAPLKASAEAPLDPPAAHADQTAAAPAQPPQTHLAQPAQQQPDVSAATTSNAADVTSAIRQDQAQEVTQALAFYRQKTSAAIDEEDLRAVLRVLAEQQPQTLAALERERRSARTAPDGLSAAAPAVAPLDQFLLEASYATTYDQIVRDHSAVYLPAYFARHLRHLGAADGLRFMALRQVAYQQGLHAASGSQLLTATIKELSRWSTLQPRRIYGGLEDPSSYLYLLAGKVPYLDYYATRPSASRWEDDNGYHWHSAGREYCIWKRPAAASSECSQRIRDRSSGGGGEMQWRQAPSVFRVQLSLPLCPEDEQALRATLTAFGVRADPLNAIQRCLALPREAIIPDQPSPLASLPPRLYTVQEVVLEAWGRSQERELVAQIMAQAKLLEDHLLRGQHDLLKIPFYLLEKWGPYLSPAQLWTAILAMDRVYSGAAGGEYRDTVVLRSGMKEMTLWTEDQYSKGAARKVGKWLYPFNLSDGGTATSDHTQEDAHAAEHFNPWFSVFVSEVLLEGGARVKNADNSVQMKLRVLPLVPLCPQDTLAFAHQMGLTRLALRDASGQTLALEITAEELALYFADGRTLRYNHSGEVLYGPTQSVTLQVTDRNLSGLELITSPQFRQSPGWPGELFGRLETAPDALYGNLEQPASALYDALEDCPGALSGNLSAGSDALSGNLTLNPGALFGVLLKLLILNLYGIKKNAVNQPTRSNPAIDSQTPANQTPGIPTPAEKVDSLEQFGRHQQKWMEWSELDPESDWNFEALIKTLGIADANSLRARQVSAQAVVSRVLELYALPIEKFTSGRVAVLVAKLRSSPRAESGPSLRLAECGPAALQEYLRRAILNVSAYINDPDWDQTLGRARRDDLIELTEKLGLGKVVQESGTANDNMIR